MQMRRRSRQWGDKRPRLFLISIFSSTCALKPHTYYKLRCHRRSFNFLVLFAHLNISGAARGDLRRETHSKSGEIFAGLIARAPTAAGRTIAKLVLEFIRQKMREKHTHTHSLAVNKCIAQFFRLSFTRTPRLAARRTTSSITFLCLEREPRPEMDKLQIILLVLSWLATCF